MRIPVDKNIVESEVENEGLELGADLQVCVLVFAKRRRVKPTGIDGLAIHFERRRRKKYGGAVSEAVILSGAKVGVERSEITEGSTCCSIERGAWFDGSI